MRSCKNWLPCLNLLFLEFVFCSFIPSSKEKLKRSNYLQTNTLPSPKAHSKHTTGTTVKAQWWREPKSCANREDELGSHVLNCTASRFSCSPQLGFLDTVSATMFPNSCCSQPLLFWTLSLRYVPHQLLFSTAGFFRHCFCGFVPQQLFLTVASVDSLCDLVPPDLKDQAVKYTSWFVLSGWLPTTLTSVALVVAFLFVYVGQSTWDEHYIGTQQPTPPSHPPPSLLPSLINHMIVAIFDYIHVALFSALEQTHCTRMWFYMSD